MRQSITKQTAVREYPPIDAGFINNVTWSRRRGSPYVHIGVTVGDKFVRAISREGNRQGEPLQWTIAQALAKACGYEIQWGGLKK